MESIQTNFTDSPSQFAKNYLFRLVKYIDRLSFEEFDHFIELLKQTSGNSGRVFFLGNGGSASASTHFANDLYCATRNSPHPLMVQSLVDNQALVTALANDHGFEQIFKIQLETFLKPNDMVVALSASGNSKNLVRGIEFANQVGATTFSIVGFDGGLLKKISHHSIHVETTNGDYGPIEDLHLVINHMTADYFKNLKLQ